MGVAGSEDSDHFLLRGQPMIGVIAGALVGCEEGSEASRWYVGSATKVVGEWSFGGP